MTREERLQFAKERAMEYVHAGDLTNAVASMGSDLSEYGEFKNVAENLAEGMHILLSREFNKKDLITRWIQGFH